MARPSGRRTRRRQKLLLSLEERIEYPRGFALAPPPQPLIQTWIQLSEESQDLGDECLRDDRVVALDKRLHLVQPVIEQLDWAAP
jgi:hypothetical protein